MTIHAQPRPYNWNPELAINPPCPDDGTYERNVRNGLRDEICEAMSLIDSRLGELDDEEFDEDLMNLAKLREKMRHGMED